MFMVATVVDDMIVKGCRFSVRAVVAQVVTYNMAYVVEYFVLNLVGSFVMYLVSILVDCLLLLKGMFKWWLKIHI